ncbi:MAG TPA: thioesterase family protein [Chloroflexota bacterium]|nr:thioesterase family protein [Chloroflexota bacterium]
MIFEHRFRVRYAETDTMGVAHHSSYLVWFEAGRVEFLRSLGFAWAEVEASGYAHAVHEVHVQYRRAVRFDQLLTLCVAVVSAAGPRLVFGYRLYDAAELDADPEAKPVAVASTEMVWVTPSGRPTRLPASHPLHPVLAGIERHPHWGQGYAPSGESRAARASR